MTDTSAVQLLSSSPKITRIDITVTNGPVAVGFSNSVSAVPGSEIGIVLYPGNTPYTIYVEDPTLIYVAGANGRRACFSYFV
jgi:hypothetical protein